MSSVADRLNVSKSELLDPSSNNAAVRLALAETHVIAETKKYFENVGDRAPTAPSLASLTSRPPIEQEGVDLTSLASRGPRSPTTILVKNIPYNTTTATLSSLFAPFGAIARLLLPPAGTMAIVEMAEPGAAADAWRNLVYKKLGGSVLYLEKAAAGVWNGTSAAPATSPSPALPTPSTSEKASPADGEEGSTLFVKNLAFATTSDSLRAAFASLPDFLFARVQTKPNPKEAGRTLSMGFGFVGFRTAAAAAAALRAKDKLFLEGHQLEIKFAQRGKESSSKANSSKSTSTSTKLIVKNVPFEVTRKEIRELFRSVQFPACPPLDLRLSREHTLTPRSPSSRQCLWPAQVSPPSSQVRPQDSRLRFPRLRFSSRCRSCVRRVGAYPSPRSAPCAAVGRGRRGRSGWFARAHGLLRIKGRGPQGQIRHGRVGS